MEFGLLQLAVTHILAARAGHWLVDKASDRKAKPAKAIQPTFVEGDSSTPSGKDERHQRHEDDESQRNYSGATKAAWGPISRGSEEQQHAAHVPHAWLLGGEAEAAAAPGVSGVSSLSTGPRHPAIPLPWTSRLYSKQPSPQQHPDGTDQPDASHLHSASSLPSPTSDSEASSSSGAQPLSQKGLRIAQSNNSGAVTDTSGQKVSRWRRCLWLLRGRRPPPRPLVQHAQRRRGQQRDKGEPQPLLGTAADEALLWRLADEQLMLEMEEERAAQEAWGAQPMAGAPALIGAAMSAAGNWLLGRRPPAPGTSAAPAQTPTSSSAAPGSHDAPQGAPPSLPPLLVGNHALGGGGGRPADAAAATLSSSSGTLGELAERAVEAPVRGLRQLNRVVAAGMSDFLASDPGRRMSEGAAADTGTGPLMGPMNLTEDFVRAWLKSLVMSNVRFLVFFLGGRVAVASLVLHLAKGAAKRAARRSGSRVLSGAVDALCDVALPTPFFGPLLGLTSGTLELVGVGRGPLALLALRTVGRGGCAGKAAAVDTVPPPPPLVAGLPGVAAVASGTIGALLDKAVALSS